MEDHPGEGHHREGSRLPWRAICCGGPIAIIVEEHCHKGPLP